MFVYILYEAHTCVCLRSMYKLGLNWRGQWPGPWNLGADLASFIAHCTMQCIWAIFGITSPHVGCIKEPTVQPLVVGSLVPLLFQNDHNDYDGTVRIVHSIAIGIDIVIVIDVSQCHWHLPSLVTPAHNINILLVGNFWSVHRMSHSPSQH